MSGSGTLSATRWLPLAVTLPAVSFMLFSPGSTVPSTLPHADKVLHLLMFGALAVSCRWAGVSVVATLGSLLVFAVLSEVLQAHLPINRSGNMLDVLADGVGIVCGLLLAQRLSRPPHSRIGM